MAAAGDSRNGGRVPSYCPRNLFETDAVLIGALSDTLTEAAEKTLSEHGAHWGSAETRELVRLAEANPPRLVDRDAWGDPVDAVEYHPARHALVRRACEAGLAVALWDEEAEERPRRHTLRAARLLMSAQTEIAHLSAPTTTSAVIGTLLAGGEIGNEWLARALPRRYDHRFAPVGGKTGVTLGLALSERTASWPGTPPEMRAIGDETSGFRLDGLSWFLAAPMNDAFLTVARTADGPRLFLVPRHRVDGSVNSVRLTRLKTTLGTRAEAIAEVRLEGAAAWPVGRADEAADLIQRTLAALRFDAIAMAAGLGRGALARAVHYTRHRRIAGEALIDQPLMVRVLADAALDSAAATALAIRIGQALDRADADEAEAAYARIVVPAARYWIAKSTVATTAEALECLGGNGFVEDHELARFHRDAPLVGLTGGAGNTLALDLLRSIEENSDAFAAAIGEIAVDLDRSTGAASAEVLNGAAQACIADQGSARILVEQLALAAAAAALHRFAPRALTEAFTDTRLAGPWRASHGMLDGRFDARGIVDFVFPEP